MAGYAPHFLHEQGYQVYSLLEATDLASSGLTDDQPKMSALDYVRAFGSDKVIVSRLDSFLKPKTEILSDEDLVSMRLKEELFDNRRGVVRESLKAIREYESQTGQSHGTAVIEELKERFEKWRAESARGLKDTVLDALFDVGAGAAVSVVCGLALGSMESPESLSVGAAWTVLQTLGRTFAWRGRQRLFKRHFLSVL